MYALGKDATTEPAASAYASAIPKGADAGTYYVWYKVVGDSNHNDFAPGCVTVTISQKQPDPEPVKPEPEDPEPVKPEPEEDTKPTNPGSGSSSTSSSSSASAAANNTASVNTVSTASTGTSAATVTDKNGKAIENAKVTVAVKDSKTGQTVTKEVLTDENGKIASNEVITVKQSVSADGKTITESKSYLANPDGTVYDETGFADVDMCEKLNRSEIDASTKIVYVNKDGSLKQSEKFSVTSKSGKKVMYAVGDDCNLIRNGFFNAQKTGQTGKCVKKGESYFAGANGKILTKTLFTLKPTKSGKVKLKINKKGSKAGAELLMDEELAYEIFDYKKGGLESASGDGVQYYATKSGSIAKDQWVNVGLKEYYCGSNGAITKSR